MWFSKLLDRFFNWLFQDIVIEPESSVKPLEDKTTQPDREDTYQLEEYVVFGYFERPFGGFFQVPWLLPFNSSETVKAPNANKAIDIFFDLMLEDFQEQEILHEGLEEDIEALSEESSFEKIEHIVQAMKPAEKKRWVAVPASDIELIKSTERKFKSDTESVAIAALSGRA